MSGSGPLRELTRSRKVDAALQNELVTRERVGEVERRSINLHTRLKATEQHLAALGVSGIRGFRSRLRWLLTGR
jgi:hypothetical protein